MVTIRKMQFIMILIFEKKNIEKVTYKNLTKVDFWKVPLYIHNISSFFQLGFWSYFMEHFEKL